MTTAVIENEHTAMTQKIGRQPDGPGKRIGKRGEISGIGKLAPGGAKLFRERLPQILAEAGYWESRVGTVHDFRVALIDNDTRMLFTVCYDGELKPYIEDIVRGAGPWLGLIFLGVWDSLKDVKEVTVAVVEGVLRDTAFECDVFYVGNPDVTVRDIAKMQRVSTAVSALLDAAA
jgi:hypothetical protein